MIELVLKVTCSVLILKVIVESILKVIVESVLKVIVESVLKVIEESVLKVTCPEVGWRALYQHQVHMSQVWATSPKKKMCESIFGTFSIYYLMTLLSVHTISFTSAGLWALEFDARS